MSSPDHKKDIDSVTGVETTGHEWDGIKELNNPAPRWWLLVWLATAIWSVGYWVVYPAWPTLSGATEGTFGYTQEKELAAAQQEIHARRAVYLDRFTNASFAEIINTPDLLQFAQAGGNAAFKDNCATCHGTGAAGGIGYPNLNDDDWLWGGSVDEIYHTISVGIRAAHADTRTSLMPAFGKDGLLTPAQIDAVTDYVLAFSGSGKKPTYEEGATIFRENCAACHGDNGTGGRDFGAPSLADAIWLYGGSRAEVYKSIYTPHAGVMPTWEGRLDPQTIRQLAIYVHQLGGGEASAPAQ